MPAIDYQYDPTGTRPENWVQYEVHDLSASVGVIPQHGAFFRDTIVIEGTVDNQRWVKLNPLVDFRPSPVFLKPTAQLGRDVISFVVIQRPFKRVRISYQVLGQLEDTAILTELAISQFDRKNPSAWLAVRGEFAYDPSSFNRSWRGMGEAEAVSQGMEQIRQALTNLKGNGEKATLAQVTALEVRQSNLERLLANTDVEFSDVMGEFNTLWELYHILEDYFVNGGRANTGYPEGYIYSSDGPATHHLIQHDLNTHDLHLTFWSLEADGLYKMINAPAIQETENRISVTLTEARKLIAIVRPATDFGYAVTTDDPVTELNVGHGLNTGFVASTVWAEVDGRWSLLTDHGMEMVDEDTVRLYLGSPIRVRVVLEPPTPNAFAYKSQPADDHHVVTHYLGTHYFTATAWVETEAGQYVLMDDPDIVVKLASLNHVDLALSLPANVKVIFHPVGLERVNFDQDILTKQMEIEDAQSRIEARLDAVNEALQRLSIKTSFDYDSTAPALVHTVQHNLDSFFVDAAVWVQDPVEMNYEIEYPTIHIVDVNTIVISLTESRNIHALVMRGGA